MLARLFALTALTLLSAAYLSYEHVRPWVTFNSEMLTCLAAICALLGLSLKTDLTLPKRFVWLFALACIPLAQYSLGQIFFWGNAVLTFAYLALFALMACLGYNLALTAPSRVALMQSFCWMLLLVGAISGFIAIVQWLQLEQKFFWMMGLSSSRPYANFAQPNNFATFAIMALLANMYLIERRHIYPIVGLLVSVLFIFAIVLTQSRTAWLTMPLIVLYWAYRQKQHVQFLTTRYVCAGLGLFIALVLLLPALNQLLNQQLGVQAINTASAVARAGGGHERLTMWQQMFAAIQLQPWTGYGWGQIAYAQSQVLDRIPLKIWFNSSHNLWIDLIVVNGVLLGTVVVLAIWAWLWQLHRNTTNTEAVIAFLMVIAILMHAMLEYPQRYAYFLLPLGLLLGVVQAQQRLSVWRISRWLPAALAVFGFALWGLVWRDYSLGIDNIKAARVIDNQRLNTAPVFEQVTTFTPPHQIYVLDQFSRTAQWVSINPFIKMDNAQIERYGQIVAMSPSRKNLVKYAQLLAYNGQKQRAQKQLTHLYLLYKIKMPYEELFLRNR